METKRSEALAQIQSKATELVELAKETASHIESREDAERACQLQDALADLERQIHAVHDPAVEAALAAHRAAVAARKQLLEPVEQARSLLKKALIQWQTQQKELAAKAAMEAQKAAMQAAEAARVQIAEQTGVPPEEIAMVAPKVEPISAPKVVAVRTIWQAEVYDLMALLKAIVDGQQPIEYVQPNMTALNARARADKTLMKVPGVRAIAKQV